MQFPPGMANMKPATMPGWQANLGGSVITWTGGRIQQGKTDEFEIAGQFPNTPGKTLKFPVVQTYGNGTVVALDRRAVVADARSHDPAHGGGRASATSAATPGGHHSHDSH